MNAFAEINQPVPRHRPVRAVLGLALAVLTLLGCGRPNLPPIAPSRPAQAAIHTAGVPVPGQFLWGVSTAGYQWEGQDHTSQWAKWDADGKTSERNPLGANGLVQYQEDMGLARGLGCNAFRTSLEWARLEPKEGEYDLEAIAHYHRVLDAMHDKGLTPLITLMHFSYPAWLDADGGWENDKAPVRFARFAAFVAKEFGSKIQYYMTFNEPNVYLMAGYLAGMMPPGKADPLAGLRAMRRMIKGHALAYDALHAGDPDAKVSFNMYTAEYATSTPPVPANANETTRPARDLLSSDTYFMDQVNGQGSKLDYAALDYYCKFRVALPFIFPRPDGWEVYPEGLYRAIKKYHTRYKLPVLIAENGMATNDLVPRRDRWSRSAYIVAHVRQVQHALSDGIPVLGYVHWSITDNYEWGTFAPRFGLYSVNARQQDFRRVEADGVEAFRRVIGAGGITTDIALRYPPPGPPVLPAPWIGGGTGTPVHQY